MKIQLRQTNYPLGCNLTLGVGGTHYFCLKSFDLPKPFCKASLFCWLQALLLSQKVIHIFQTKIVKCLWFSFVCLGFVGAGLLIGKSYVEWQKSPVSTSISTLSISDLEFPNVTVCPPKGSNTALNYDLMKADNHMLTEEEKNKLSQDAYSVFVDAPFQDYFDRLLSQVNPENTENLFRGYQSIPKVTDGNVTETRFFSLKGTFHTPWFGGDFEESFFESDQQHRVRLEFPENLKEQIGSGRLVIELEVDTRKGLNETVWIRNDTAAIFVYKFHSKAENWEDAERICDTEGDHLASIQTHDQQRLVAEYIRQNVCFGEHSSEYFWVGATNNETAGVWEWERNHTCTAVRRSTGRSPLTTIDKDCSNSHAFICQAGRTSLSGKTSLTLTYTKDEPTFSFFHVQYSYTPTHSEQETSSNERRMTGFKLSWKIQNKNPPLYLETEEVGQVIETPGFRGPYRPEFYTNDHIFVATLKVPENLLDQVGNGSLVIEVEVDLSEGWTEEVQISRGGPKVFTVHPEEKSWYEAEAYCKSMGGNLASIGSGEELQKIDISSYYYWIGGIYEEGRGTWSWSDGSPWIYSPWGSGYGTHRGGKHCVYLWYDKLFYDDLPCGEAKAFICQTTWHTLKERANFTFNFTQEEIPLTPFKVRYNYAASQQKLSDHGKEGQMTGFRLDWFIRDRNGSRVTNGKEANDQDWQPLVTAKYENPWLKRLVELARQARLQNISTEGLVERSLNNTKLSSDDTYCRDGQLQDYSYEQFFTKLEGTITPIANLTSFENVDFHSGTKIFFAMTLCPHPMSLKLLDFFKGIFDSQGPRAIIRTVVDTIQSGTVQNGESMKRLNKLYLVLEKKYDLQYGKFLLALSSMEDLEEMMNKGWPFFAKYAQEMDLCFNGTTCRGLNDVIARIGENRS